MISEHRLMRRVAGYHDLRLDGISDLVLRARGASVLDIGCNRGLVAFEMANNGASLVHGCDNYEQGIATARELFCDLRNVRSRFEVVDLAGGGDALQAAFGKDYPQHYDIVLMLATYHKLKRGMGRGLGDLMVHFAERTGKYFGWRGKLEEMAEIDALFAPLGLQRVQTSQLSENMEPAAAIWARR